MTNVIAPPALPAEPIDVTTALEKSYRDAERMRNAADAVASTFRWCHVVGLRPILLLDFDVICGALPSLAIQQKIHQREETDDAWPMSRLWGPAQLRVVFHHVDDLVVPPGTAAELFSGMERLRVRLSRHAESFVQRIRSASKLDDPGKILTDLHHVRERDILFQDITQFREDTRDHEILQGLLSRAVPAESLLTTSTGDAAEAEAFRNSYGFLNFKRPQRPINNFNDALNVALVIRLFNNRVVSSGSGRLPVLISDTRAIRDLNSLAGSFLRHLGLTEERPLLFHDSLFLAISQGLLRRTENRFGVAADEAKQLATESSAIASGCLSLLKECSALKKNGRESKALRLDDLSQPDVDLLYYRRELFERRWSRVFAPSIVAAERDRLDYVQFLLSPAGRDLVAAESTQAVADLQEKLEDSSPDNYALWNLLLQHRQSAPVIEIRRRSFDFYLAQNDGMLLRDLQPSVRLDNGSRASTDGDHNFRVVVSPAYISSGVVFSIATFRNSDISHNRYVSFTWLHNKDARTISNSLRRLLSVSSRSSDRTLLSLFNHSSRIDSTLGQNDDIETRFSQSGSMGEQPIPMFEFAQLQSGKSSVFADLQLLEGLEMQANLTIDATLLSTTVYDALIEAVSSSCEILITSDYLREVLAPVWKYLGLGVR